MILPGVNLSTPARSMPWTGNRVADTILREMEAHRKRLGAQLLELRKARGWSQEDAAHEIGVGVKTWRLWERAKTLPYDSNIRRLAEVFEVDPDYFGQLRPAPLGLDVESAAEPLAETLAQLLAAVTKQNELLERQSEVLERIEARLGEDRGVRDEIAELISRRGQELVRGLTEDEPDPPPNPRQPVAAATTPADRRRTR